MHEPTSFKNPLMNRVGGPDNAGGLGFRGLGSGFHGWL